MTEQETHILIAEDLPENRFALKRLFKKSEFKGKFTFAHDGDQAWDLLTQNPEKYTIALLDRMMPGMSGLDVLLRMKQDNELKHIPVVFQTAMAQVNDVIEGFKAGAFYYITKPYPDRESFLSIIRSAISERTNFTAIQVEMDKSHNALSLLNNFDLKFKNLDELQLVACLISKACPDPTKISMGISEILINAVEHGNLGIGYDEKTMLNNEGNWEQEVRRRLELPEHADKMVSVEFIRGKQDIRIIIKDQGLGFDWADYKQMNTDRAFDNHGRGIAMAIITSFDQLEYKGSGNEVHAIINL